MQESLTQYGVRKINKDNLELLFKYKILDDVRCNVFDSIINGHQNHKNDNFLFPQDIGYFVFLIADCVHTYMHTRFDKDSLNAKEIYDMTHTHKPSRSCFFSRRHFYNLF